MGFLKSLFGNKSSASSQQAVLVYLDGTNLPPKVYEECDLSTIGEQLTEAIARGKLGEFDGDGASGDETVLYMYGPDAERLFEGIEKTLRGYPLCAGARVVIRSGGPGAPEREVRL
jgi:hypothetical protein